MAFKFLFRCSRLLLLFFRNVVGCINNPYSTYRMLSAHPPAITQVIPLFLLIACYFAWASAIRAGIRNPYVLTIHFNILALAGSMGFLSMVLILWSLGKRLGGVGQVQTIAVLWAYSLLPTVLWFGATSVLYLVLPPPRTFGTLGTVYSILFIACSLALLGWKVILYYLTLRFGMRLDLKRITLLSSIVLPLIGVYAVILYQLGVTRIPFL